MFRGNLLCSPACGGPSGWQHDSLAYQSPKVHVISKLAEGIVCSILQITTGDVEWAGPSKDPCGTPLQHRPPTRLCHWSQPLESGHSDSFQPASLLIQPLHQQLVNEKLLRLII